MRPGNRPTRAGFTLVELLVVISIIALLIAILLPALAKAKESSQRVHCGSNLRQVATAMIMFANDHKGHFPNTSGVTTPDNIQVRWFGGNKGSEFFQEHGLIYPYLRNADVGGCTSFDFDDVRPFYGPVDYAYSSVLGTGKIRPLGVKMTKARKSSETVLLFDSARVNNWHYNPARVDRTPWGYPPTRLVPSFHARHNRVGNVAWVDGHVSAEIPTFYPAGSITVQMLKAHNIGDIDRDKDQKTDELFDLE